MFITIKYSGYNQKGEQSSGGYFLILADKQDKPNSIATDGTLWAAVRYARMTQCGQFMMASVQLGPKRIVLSGTFGGDGLPALTLTDPDNLSLAKYFTQVPTAIANDYWHQDDFNTNRLREWVLTNLSRGPHAKTT